MKKSLYGISLLALLLVVFLGGARFNQREAGRSTAGATDRQILHYVDPMNPAHTSQEPGIAPCGMPMEPVYAAKEPLGDSEVSGRSSSTPLGAVNINLQKQQIIGVQVGEVTQAAEAYSIRALGRIVPDENRVYALIAATDGWIEEINGATTGSLVNKNQVMAQIKINNYDFFTWQQRYLTERGYTGRASMSASPPSEADQGRRRLSSAYQAGLPSPESEIQMTTEALSDNAQTNAPHQPEIIAEVKDKLPQKTGTDHSEHMGSRSKGKSEGPGGIQDTNLLYTSKGRQELLNLGVAETQLQELAESGTYITHVDLRSPVDGLVLARKVSPLQKIERGVECFRIADLGRVWIEADIYDLEAKSIQPGMEARVSLPRQREHFTATVSEVPPRFDPASRSLKVRLEMDNPENALRPEMFVDVEFLITRSESVTVPAGAVLDSGIKKTVYVVMGEGVFEPRAVVTGWQGNDRVEIVSGLQPGDKIAVSGTFLIDSDSRMKLATARLMEEKVDKAPDAPMPVSLTAPAPQPLPPIIQEGTLTDPVCGMAIDPDKAKAAGLIVEAEGVTHYFCSEDCKEQFKQNPHRAPVEKTDTQVPPGAPDYGVHHHD